MLGRWKETTVGPTLDEVLLSFNTLDNRGRVETRSAGQSLDGQLEVGKLVTHEIEEGDCLAEGSAMDKMDVEKLFDEENLCERAEVLMAVPKGTEDGVAGSKFTDKGQIDW
jgi:hypothetical protein